MAAIGLVGLALVVFGLGDIIGSFIGIDVWRDYIGWTDMPDILWRFSGYAETALGYFLLQIGGGGDEEEPVFEEEEEEDEEALESDDE